MPTAADTDSKPIKKHAGGRPTKYNQALIRKAYDYLENYQSLGHKIPTLAGLALTVDIDKETATRWGKDKNKQEFSKLVKRIMVAQEQALLDNGLDGTYNASITKLCLSKHGYQDNPQANQASSGITVNVNRGGVVIKSGSETLAIETDEPKGVTIDHEWCCKAAHRLLTPRTPLTLPYPIGSTSDASSTL